LNFRIFLQQNLCESQIPGFPAKIKNGFSKLPPSPDPYEHLTDREKQVLKLIAEGYTHKEIASALNISDKTVIAHQSNISEKLGIHTKAEFIKFAITRGIIKV